MPKLKTTPIHIWFKKATTAERQRMATLVGVSFHYVRSIAYGNRNGAWEVVMNMAWAARLIREEGSETAKRRLPYVQRGDVSPICAECPFYQVCKKAGIKEVNAAPEAENEPA